MYLHACLSDGLDPIEASVSLFPTEVPPRGGQAACAATTLNSRGLGFIER